MEVPEALLAPIPGDSPQGIDLRNPRAPELSEMVNAVRFARNPARAGQPENVADWAAVEHLCHAILTQHSKDLEAAAGLAAAWTHNQGFAGLAAGGTLIAGLVERFWPVLFPALQQEGGANTLTPEAARLRPLNSLVGENGALLPAIRSVVLFRLEDATDFSYAGCMDCKASSKLSALELKQRLADLNEVQRVVRAKSPRGRNWDQVCQAVGRDAGKLLIETAASVGAALAAWRNVAVVIRQEAGEAPFSCGELQRLLGEVHRIVNEVAPAAPEAVPAPGDVVPAETAPQASAAAMVPSRAVLSTREDALKQLDEVAEFFRKTEPHSPVAYTLDEAMRRARLTWPEWLAEAVPDKQMRDAIRSRLGLRPDGG